MNMVNSGSWMGKVRAWKPAQKARGSSVKNATPQLKDSWEKRMQQRTDRASVLEMQKSVDDEIRAEKKAEREQREEKERKKKENQDKGVSHQIITNTAKIKKMSKKQLRNIKKADTSGVAPKQYGGISKKSLQ